MAAIALLSCAGLDAALQDHQEKLESLGATTKTLADAWLGGHVSGTYTQTAFERTRRLVEQERTSLAGKAPALADPRGARLSMAAERLSRLLAALNRDVEARDASSLRQHMTQIPILPPR